MCIERKTTEMLIEKNITEISCKWKKDRIEFIAK